MTKIFRRCTISVGLAPLANKYIYQESQICTISYSLAIITRKRYSVGHVNNTPVKLKIYIKKDVHLRNDARTIIYNIIQVQKTFKNEQRNRDDTAKKRVNTSGVWESNNYYEDIYNTYTS